jgi:hypothetical protein
LHVHVESFENLPSGQAYLKVINWLKGKSYAFICLDNYLVKRDRSASINESIGLGVVTIVGSGLALRVAQ